MTASAQTVSVFALKDLGEFTITFSGSTQTTPLSHKQAVYYEWGYGNASEYSMLYHTDSDLTVATPRGTLLLSVNLMRPYLSPTAKRTYSAKKLKGVPEVIREALKTKSQVVATEYAIVPGKKYYAKVTTESYMLPPRDGGPPSRRTNYVLTISDSPFIDGKPKQPSTPAFKGRTY